MKKPFKLIIFLIVAILFSGFSIAHAFNSATHMYIAEQIFQVHNVDLGYGSISPDLSLYIRNPEKWPTAFEDTHYTYLNLMPYAKGYTKKVFSLGWITHNEFWGADYIAHIEYPPGNDKGYVIEKAQILSDLTDLDPEFAHYAIEVAIDLLLRNNDDFLLGQKLLEASVFRSWKDRNLLAEVLVRKERKTDWLTLATAELTFRNLIGRYAIVLALPDPLNIEFMSILGVKLAEEMYGIEVTKEEVLEILEISIGLCEADYKEVIDFTIEQIKNNIRLTGHDF